MADELQYAGFLSETGLTVTAKVFDDAGDQVGGDVSCPETNETAYYVGDFPVSVTTEDTYLVRFFDAASKLLGQVEIEWTGTLEATNLAILSAIGSVATDVWGFVLENSRTAQGFMRIMLSSAAGVLSGANTTNVLIRDDADTKDRIDAKVDEPGNRITVTLDDT